MASRHRPEPSHGNGPLILILGLVVLVGGVLAVMNMSQAQERGTTPDPVAPSDDDGASGAGSDPFGDVEIQLPGAGRRLQDLAPAGLRETPTFAAAEVKADEAMALVDQAYAAQADGDTARFRELGLRAKEMLEEATESTTDWWLELDMKYPNDRQVEQISRVRAKWGKALKRVRVIK